MIDVSIVIVNWNTYGLLHQCLDSVYRAGTDCVVEVIVVDNGSTDNSVDMITERFPEVILIRNDQNLGFARANNQGLSRGKGRYFLLLNSDTIVNPGSVDMLVDVADQNPQLGVVGPKVLNMDGSIQNSCGGFPSFLSELVGKNYRTRHPVTAISYAYEVDWILGACMLVRSSTIMDVGPFDEDYFFYSEEIDWCFRIKKKNWKIWYITNADIYHLGGGSTHVGSLAQLVRLYQGKLLYFQKHHGRFTATLLRFGLAIANSFGIIRRLIFSNWMRRNDAYQRIINQSKLVWCLLRNQYPKID